MAFFKFRKNADDPVSAPAQPQSIESLRQRAKYRLVGATVLVLIGVIGLPLLFDKQPRPIALDTPIEIPDKNKVLPLQIPAPLAPAPAPAILSPSAVPAVALATNPSPNLVTDQSDRPVAAPSAVSNESEKKVPLVPVGKAIDATKSIEKVGDKEASLSKQAGGQMSAATSKATEASRAQSLLEGKKSDANVSAKAVATSVAVPAATASAAKPAIASAERYVVQVGAFAENTRAREARLKVESAGLKTYAQVAETKDGRRIRIRVGPFATKAEAEKAAEKIKKLQLPAALLKL
jgi:DedD protein